MLPKHPIIQCNDLLCCFSISHWDWGYFCAMQSGKQQGGWEETRLNFLRLQHTEDFWVRLMKSCKFTRDHLCLTLHLQHIFRDTQNLPRCTQRARPRAGGQCWVSEQQLQRGLLGCFPSTHQRGMCLGLLWWIQVPSRKPALDKLDKHCNLDRSIWYFWWYNSHFPRRISKFCKIIFTLGTT